MPIFGTHVSSAGGAFKSPARGAAVGCEAIQLFAKNNNQWMGKPISDEQAACFQEQRKKHGIKIALSHAGYLINLAAPNPENYKKSLASMQQEIELANKLGLEFIVLHPGAHRGEGEQKGIEQIIKSLNLLIDKTPEATPMILLETTAGQGTSIGHRFEHLAQIIDGVENKERIGICLDTCHIFAAGYDLREDVVYKNTWEIFEKIIGRSNLKVIHLNDSKKEFDSKRDRHEHIGKGFLGREAFALLVNDPLLQDIPMVLETPKKDPIEDDLRNLALLKELINRE